MTTMHKRMIPSKALRAEIEQQMLPFCPFTEEMAVELLGSDGAEDVGSKLGALTGAGYLSECRFHMGGTVVVRLDEFVVGDDEVTHDTVSAMLSDIHDILTDRGLSLYVTNTSDGWW